jgi:hypothetical protein
VGNSSASSALAAVGRGLLSRGDGGREETIGEGSGGGSEAAEEAEEERLERPPASESDVKDVLIPSMEWKFRLENRVPPNNNKKITC